MTSVALMRAKAESPGLRASSRTASAVMMAVTRWPPTARTTLASRPSTDDFHNRAQQLVAAADARRGALRRCGQELLQRLEGNAVVAARRLDGANAAGEDPVLEGGVADAEFFRRLAGGEQGG